MPVIRKRLRTYTAIIGLFSLVLLLGACSGAGATNGGESAAPASSNSSSPAASSGQPTEDSSAFPRTIKAANGDVEIAKRPERIAVVHWGYSDSLLLFNLKSAALVLPFTEKQSVLHTDSYIPYVDRLDEL